MDSQTKKNLEHLIKQINLFIETYTLRKILIIIGCFFSFLIITRIVYDHYETKYDCSENSDLIVDKIIECKQQFIDADIKQKQLDLQSYKIEEDYSLQKLKNKMSKMNLSKDTLLKELKKIQDFKLSINEDCYNQIREIMCKKIK